jgi:hypothetical protein
LAVLLGFLNLVKRDNSTRRGPIFASKLLMSLRFLPLRLTNPRIRFWRQKADAEDVPAAIRCEPGRCGPRGSEFGRHGGSDRPLPNGLGSFAACSLRRRGIFRVIPIAVATWPDEATRTSNSAYVWIAEETVEGRTYTARSRHGPANELARQLVAARLVDRPMVIRYHGLAGTLTYHSFHAAAMWTFSEGERRLRRVRHREPPEGVFLSRHRRMARAR